MTEDPTDGTEFTPVELIEAWRQKADVHSTELGQHAYAHGLRDCADDLENALENGPIDADSAHDGGADD